MIAIIKNQTIKNKYYIIFIKIIYALYSYVGGFYGDEGKGKIIAYLSN